MLLEALVITVCTTGTTGASGCNQATNAYYKQSKPLQDLNHSIESLGKKITKDHTWIVYAASPLYAMLSRRPAQINIYRGTTLIADPWNQALGLQWNY